MEKNTSEIEKLTERIAKDPKSKLFVPLAEEYKKMGNVEMAIQVLRDGLKSNPGYVTARSFLGRLLMEQGDLAGAQKDLEEVIKAIPDNLLAHRKLGDLYVLLGRTSDAVQRYKTALALNPDDKEVMSLLADLETGKDVSSRIPRPRAVSAAPAAKPQPTVAAPLAPKAAPAKTVFSPTVPPAPPAAAKAPSAPPPPPPSLKAVRAAASPSQPAAPAPPVRDEAEVIEDIVELEPLERPAASSSAEGSTSRPPAAPLPTPLVETEPPAETTFDLNEPVAEQTTGAEEPVAESWSAVEPAAPSEIRTEASDEGTDDLNTNTLAELYISQGFYEKAIEVYQGMLAERPENKALQQKLEHLRALAEAPVTSAEQYSSVPGGPVEYVPPTTDIFAEAETASSAAPSVVPPLPEQLAPSEPMAAELPPKKATQEPAPDAGATRVPQTATLRRKETIDRLESWLKNIMKEKQE